MAFYTMLIALLFWRHKGFDLPEPAYGPILRKPKNLKINSEKCKNTVDLFDK